MSTYSITFDEKRFGYLLDLFKSLKIPVREVKEEEKEDEYVPRTNEELKVDLREAFAEIKLFKQGKIQLQTWDEAKKELANE